MIEQELVLLDMPLSTRDDVLTAIAEKALQLQFINDPAKFKQGIMEREALIPTSVGFKVAIPHCKSDVVNAPFVAFLRTTQEFRWDDRNEEDVDFIFLIAIPEIAEGNLHLKFLSSISRKLMNEEFRDSLRNAKTVAEAYDILEAINKTIKGVEII